jgi:hypothetical protein
MSQVSTNLHDAILLRQLLQILQRQQQVSRQLAGASTKLQNAALRISQDLRRLISQRLGK